MPLNQHQVAMAAFHASRIFATVLGLSALTALAPASAATVTDLVPDNLPNSLAGSYLAARSADGAHDVNAAIGYFQSALEADPDNSNLIERLLLLQASNGAIDAAGALAERLAAVDARSPLARMILAARELKSGAFADAETGLAQTAKQPLPLLTAGLLSAWADQGQGQDHTDAAIKKIESLNGPSWYGIFKDYHHAILADLAGRPDEAVTAISAAFKADNSALRVVEAYARILARAGKRDDAIKALQTYATSQPNHPVIKGLLADLLAGKTPPPTVDSAQAGAAEVLYGLGSAIGTDEGVELPAAYLQLAHYLDPDSYLPLLALADMLQAAQRCEDATAIYARIPDASPLRPVADIQSGLCLDELDRVDEAATHVKRVVDADPANLEAVMALGNIYRAHNRFTEAADAYTRGIGAIVDKSKADWRIFYFRGVSYERSKHWPEAEDDFKQALQINPNQPQVLNYLGYSWVDMGMNLDQALNMIKTAVDLRPNDGYIVDSLGWAYFKLGRYNEAVTQLERAVELKPEDSVINDHLGDAFWRVGRKLEATFQWRHAKDLGPDPEERDKIVKKLESGMPADAHSAG
jgi:tetratricopeptide (TPR) repeat protein